LPPTPNLIPTAEWATLEIANFLQVSSKAFLSLLLNFFWRLKVCRKIGQKLVQSLEDQSEHVLIAIYPRPVSSPALVNDNGDASSGSGGGGRGGGGGDSEGDLDGASAGLLKGNGARGVGGVGSGVGVGVPEAREWRRDRDSRTER